MPNRLKVAMIETILALRQRGWSQRRIAHELGIDRETVARHLKQAAADSKPASAPLGSDTVEADSKPASAPLGSAEGTDGPKPASTPIGSKPDADAGSRAGRASECEPFRGVIHAKLDLGLSAQRIHQDLVADHGFTGSYYSVRRFVGRLEVKLELPFRRLECGPGEEAQVDFGTGAPIVAPDGKRRRTHVLRVVLSHSRKAFSEVVYRQTTDDFIRCLEDAFWHFGGVPQRLVLDNLRAAVTKADWFDPELNPQVRSFAAHYGVVMLPTRPYTPRHKGKVERGIDYVPENALKGRTFASLEEQSRFLLEWEQTVADDWSFNPSIKRKQVFDLATCRFIRETRDVLFLGPPGVGQSFLAQAIGYQAIKCGFAVLYRSIFDVIRDFLHDEALGGEEKIMARYLKPDLLLIDDMGMKPLPKRSGEYLFEIVMRRYETRSTMMTSNRPLEDWGKRIGDVPSATAILDRFLHHAELVTITGRSYRLRHAATKTAEPAREGELGSPPTGDASEAPSSKPAKAPLGSAKGESSSKPAKAPLGSSEA
jgi:DNA replication protein DnaC